MSSYSHACIAYIVGRLIAGTTVTSVYDCDSAHRFEGKDLPDEACLREHPCVNWSFIPGSRQIFRYQYTCSAGHSFEIAIKGNTFIGRIRENSSRFIGKVKGNSVFLYDQSRAAHFNYRISGNAISH